MAGTDERWQRVKALFQAAVELAPEDREAFLSSEAGEDRDLRREVESLLASDRQQSALLDHLHQHSAAMLGEATVVVDSRVATPGSRLSLAPGRSVGSYEIIGTLGAGAMGEVYRARDGRLNRDVALKVIAGLVPEDPTRLARFRRESQLLAALNHPNIAAIYGVEESPELRALVLELVEGPTLADRIAPGAMPIERALPIARQMVDALEAAHEQGIVHRDLKPANVKVRTDGMVKVLDFGLAKALASDAGGLANDPLPFDTAATREGIILGTAAYMAPEQAKGLPVDKRADIWAFGCVMFEMIAGRPPFRGETVTDVLAAVVKDDPEWASLPATTPPAVRRVLGRCLVKNPRQRLRDIGDARLELDGHDVISTADESTAVRDRRGRWLPWAAAAALAIGAIVIWQAWSRAREPASPLANATFTPFTSWEGNEEGAEISPNGELVAFLSDRDGEFDLWVSQVATGASHNLTRAIGPLAASGFIVRKLGFTSDGSQIWFNPGDGQPPSIIPWMGGPARPFLPAGTNTPAWSPDGRSLVYVDKANRDDPIYLADASGADKQQIFGPGNVKNMNPVWSSDSQWIYFARGAEPQDETGMDVWRLRRTGGAAERVTNQHLAINFLAPLDPSTLLYVARDEDRSGPWLWTLDVDSGRSTRVPSGVDQYLSVSASRDGRRIVATVANPSATLWRVPVIDRQAEEHDAERYPLPVPTGFAFAPRIGAQALFYLSERGTDDGLWKIQDGRASQLRRSVDGPLSEPPAVSRDGRLAVVVRRQGKRYLSIMAGDGTNAQTLAASVEIDGAAGQGAADWSPDGTRIVAGGHDAQGPALFVIPVDTGVPTRLLDGTWLNPVWSPRGDLIVYAGRSVIGQVELRGVKPDGTPVQLPRVMVRPGGYRFLPDGSGLVYVERIQSQDFWLLDLATGERRQLTRLANHGAVRTFDVTADGKAIVFDRSRQNSNIVLIELPRP